MSTTGVAALQPWTPLGIILALQALPVEEENHLMVFGFLFGFVFCARPDRRWWRKR